MLLYGDNHKYRHREIDQALGTERIRNQTSHSIIPTGELKAMVASSKNVHLNNLYTIIITIEVATN